MDMVDLVQMDPIVKEIQDLQAVQKETNVVDSSVLNKEPYYAVCSSLVKVPFENIRDLLDLLDNDQPMVNSIEVPTEDICILIGNYMDHSTNIVVIGNAPKMHCKLLGNEVAQIAVKDGERMPFEKHEDVHL